jgi:hypothetical protein
MAEAKAIGLKVAELFKAHVAAHGQPKDKTEKQSIMDKLMAEAKSQMTVAPKEKKTAVKAFGKRNARPQSSVSFDEGKIEADIKELLDGKALVKKYPKDQYDSGQRFTITMMAERNNLASYIENPDTDACLVLCKTANAEAGDLTDADVKSFSHFSGIKFNFDTFLEEVKMMNVEDMWADYVDEIKKYSRAGLKRRNEILSRGIMDHVRNLARYKEVLYNEVATSSVSSPFTIANKVYSFKDHDEKKRYISLDTKSGVFVAYQLNGIIEAASWEEFLRQFTSSKVILASKKFRLEIFGKLDVENRNAKLFGKVICDVWDTLKGKFGDKLIAVEGDEIVLDAADGDLEKLLEEKLPAYIKVTSYRLKIKEIDGERFFIKEYDYPVGKKFDVKCLRADNKMAVYKKLLAS